MNTTEINQQKVLTSKSFLLEIIKSPSDFVNDVELFDSLKSQGGLAKLEVQSRNITSCSLNTLKNASETLLNRGFTELDELRKNAKNAIEGAKLGRTTNTKTRTGLKQKIADLNTEVQVLKKSNLLMQTLISEMQGELKRLALMTSKTDRLDHYGFINKKIEAKLSFVECEGLK
jgi:hypothetical protein